MKEVTVVNYRAEDGRLFINKEDCLAYEDRIKNVSRYKKVLGEIKEFCHKLGDCDECPFLIDSYCGITNAEVMSEFDNILPANWNVEEWGKY